MFDVHPPPVLLDSAIERLCDLHVGITPLEQGAPHEKSPTSPHSFLPALDLINKGLATPERIPWTQELRARFSARFLLGRKPNDQNHPDPPFRDLAGDGFWQACESTKLAAAPARWVRAGDFGKGFSRRSEAKSNPSKGFS
jgi:hypothetical protein